MSEERAGRFTRRIVEWGRTRESRGVAVPRKTGGGFLGFENGHAVQTRSCASARRADSSAVGHRRQPVAGAADGSAFVADVVRRRHRGVQRRLLPSAIRPQMKYYQPEAPARASL